MINPIRTILEYNKWQLTTGQFPIYHKTPRRTPSRVDKFLQSLGHIDTDSNRLLLYDFIETE